MGYVIERMEKRRAVRIALTLIVVSARGQNLRPPAQAGIPWRKGMQV